MVVLARTVVIVTMQIVVIVIVEMVVVVVVKALSQASLLSGLQIEDCRIGLATASAVSAHHVASTTSIDLTFSSSPASRVSRCEPQPQVANSVPVANSEPQDPQRARPSIS